MTCNPNPNIIEHFADLKTELQTIYAQHWDNILEISLRIKNKRFESVLVPDITAVGEGRGVVMSLKLDRLFDLVSGLTVMDPKKYLAELKSMKITGNVEISNIKRVRLLLKSMRDANPKYRWIAAARLEEAADNI
ncbi:hypothetical protein AMTR_s00001p00258730 [Amborella trichopoda]|uniref:Uncharacterized protein n=1 Tax=Amborella trichopoda TaxID=13333 RepID=W1NLR1_AMBTC|nr:hypothetical protein AMTR_s00001p00258730 [Amborella trichopoda]